MKQSSRGYHLNFSDKIPSYDEALKIFNSMYMMAKRMIQNNEKYKDVSFRIGLSNIDSDSAEIRYEKNGKKGRPRKYIAGDEVGWHIHLYAFNVYDYKVMASSFIQELKEKNQNKGYKIDKNQNDNIKNGLNYIKKQSVKCQDFGKYFNSQK